MSSLTLESFSTLYLSQFESISALCADNADNSAGIAGINSADSAIHFPDVLRADSVVRRLFLIADSLIDDAKRFNLTSITEPSEVVRKHIIDSILPLAIFARRYGLPKKCADIGTGAGFPLLPMAAVLAELSPSSRLLGVDSTAKKISHITASAEYAGLCNVSAISGRAEELAGAKNSKYRCRFDFVTARAVASLPVLLELCAPFVAEGGYFAALKSHADEEIAAGEGAAALLGMTRIDKIDYEIPFGDERCVIIYRRVSPLSPKYPRRYAEISSHPL